LLYRTPKGALMKIKNETELLDLEDWAIRIVAFFS
jgi:hypothetical protein